MKKLKIYFELFDKKYVFPCEAIDEMDARKKLDEFLKSKVNIIKVTPTNLPFPPAEKPKAFFDKIFEGFSGIFDGIFK